MAAQFKLDEKDEEYFALPSGAIAIFEGVTGTETWIERERDTVVGISIKSVGVCTSEAGTLQACIEIGGSSAKGQDGPAAIEAQLRVGQSVQVLVKAGERLAFKAYPVATNAQILRTVVWASDMESRQEREASEHAAAERDPSKDRSTLPQNTR